MKSASEKQLKYANDMIEKVKIQLSDHLEHHAKVVKNYTEYEIHNEIHEKLEKVVLEILFNCKEASEAINLSKYLCSEIEEASTNIDLVVLRLEEFSKSDSNTLQWWSQGYIYLTPELKKQAKINKRARRNK